MRDVKYLPHINLNLYMMCQCEYEVRKHRLQILIWFDTVDFKNRSYFTAVTAKWVYWLIVGNCNSGEASYAKTIHKSSEQRRGACFYSVLGENRRGLLWTKVHWRITRVLGCGAFSLAARGGQCTVAGAGRDVPSFLYNKSR